MSNKRNQNAASRRVQESNRKIRSDDKAACADCENYLMSVLDPANYGPTRYPDDFSEKTSVYRSVTNVDIPVFSRSYGNVDKGEFRIMVHPEIKNSIMVLSEDDSSHLAYGSVTTNTPTSGFRDANNRPQGGLDHPPVSYAGEDSYVVCPVTTSDGSPQYPYYANDDSGVGKYYFNMGISAGGKVRILFQSFKEAGSTTGDLTLQQIASDGTILATSGAVAYTGATDNLELLLSLAATPEGTKGYRLFLSNTVTSGNGMSFSASLITHHASLSGMWWKTVPLRDINLLMNDLSKYRVTAQSSLLTYMSNRLTVAGQVSSLLYRGGVPALMRGVSDYSEIAATKDSYNGPLLDGSYVYWEGQDTSDMIFRTVDHMDQELRPYTLISGVFSAEGNPPTDPLRLRVVTSIEFTSISQLFESEPSPVKPDVLVAAALVLSHTPNAMENGKHLDRIRKIANKVGHVVKRLGGFLWSHRGELQQAGTALAPLFV